MFGIKALAIEYVVLRRTSASLDSNCNSDFVHRVVSYISPQVFFSFRFLFFSNTFLFSLFLFLLCSSFCLSDLTVHI
jgi:hypothetical protein